MIKHNMFHQERKVSRSPGYGDDDDIHRSRIPQSPGTGVNGRPGCEDIIDEHHPLAPYPGGILNGEGFFHIPFSPVRCQSRLGLRSLFSDQRACHTRQAQFSADLLGQEFTLIISAFPLPADVKGHGNHTRRPAKPFILNKDKGQRPAQSF